MNRKFCLDDAEALDLKFIKELERQGFNAEDFDYFTLWSTDDIQLDGDFTFKQIEAIYRAMKSLSTA
jgi:hypothetical protein